MRTARLTLLMVGAITCAAGCGGREEPRFGVAETKILRQRTADFAAAFNSKDADKVLSFYSSEIVFMPGYGTGDLSLDTYFSLLEELPQLLS